MIKGIATDCFGVLYNDILKDMLRRHSVTDPAITAPCFKAAGQSDLGAISLDEFFDELSQLTGIPLKTVQKEMLDTSHLNEGLVEIFKSLKPAYKLGMITDVDATLLEPFLANKDVRDLFDEIVISSEAQCAKPQRQIFDVLLKRFNLEPAEIILIDNSEVNTRAATELGMKTILFTTNELLSEKLHTLLAADR